MIFTPGNDYSAVLDACVLVPMALCDLLLRLAEEPAMYRPLWSEQILAEMAKALKTKLHRSAEAAAWRRQQMKQAFPEAMVTVPSALLKATPGIFRKIVARNTTSSAKRRMIFWLISTVSIRNWYWTNWMIRQPASPRAETSWSLA